MSKWEWWTGTENSVDDDSTYDIGCFRTRDEAFRAGIRDTDPGEAFYIIEARTSDDEDDRDEDDRMPFIEARNQERIVNDWNVVSSQGGPEHGSNT